MKNTNSYNSPSYNSYNPSNRKKIPPHLVNPNYKPLLHKKVEETLKKAKIMIIANNIPDDFMEVLSIQSRSQKTKK